MALPFAQSWAVDPLTSAYFGPQDQGDGSGTLGSGAGYDWLRGLAGLQGSEVFYRPAVQSGDSSSEAFISRDNLAGFLGERGWELREAYAGPGLVARWVQDSAGQLQTAVETIPMEDRVFGYAASLAAAVVGGAVAAWAGGASASSAAADPVASYLTTGAVEGSTVGGAWAGGGSAGAVGSGSVSAALQGAQAAAWTGARQGTINGLISEASGGDFADGFVSGFTTGAVGSGIGFLGIPEAVGVTYQPAAAVVNSSLAGGLLAEARGGDFADGAQAGAVGAVINQALQGVFDYVAGLTAPAPAPLQAEADELVPVIFGSPLSDDYAAGLVGTAPGPGASLVTPGAFSGGSLIGGGPLIGFYTPPLFTSPAPAAAPAPRPSSSSSSSSSSTVRAADLQRAVQIIASLTGGGAVAAGGALTAPGATPTRAPAAAPLPLSYLAAGAAVLAALAFI